MSIVISLRDYFWDPKPLWLGRIFLRANVVGIFSIIIHGCGEEGMTWKEAIGVVLGAMFLCESVYLWWVTGLMRRHQLPMILRYKVTREPISWPAHRHFLGLRDYFRREHFQPIGTFQISFYGIPLMLNIVMLDASGRIRLEIFFRMGMKGIRQIQFALSSHIKENELMVTDNLNVPSMGLIPQRWKIKRYRFASPETLLRRHRRRLQKLGCVCDTWDVHRVLEELNHEQGILEEENFQKCLLEKSSDGRQYILSDEGRYRLWKSTLLLHYLGVA
jgi:hypothetical protein